MFEITSINLKIAKDEEPVKAYCSFVICDSFAVRKVRIIEKDGEYMVCMPSIKSQKDGKYMDVCHPINPLARQKIVTAILNAYRGQLESEVV